MPKSKLNSKKHVPSIRSNSPKRIITFHNSINEIINKFENSQKTLVLDHKKSIKIPGKLQNNFNDLSIYGGKIYNSTQLNRKNQSVWNNRAIKMVDSISDDVIDNHNGSTDHIDDDQINDSGDEIYDEIETFDDPDYEYIPIDTKPIVSPTKFMRLRNINIVQCQLNIFQRFVGILLNLPFLWSINGAGLSTLTCAFFLPRILCENIVYPVFRLIFGTLYPAYASYKAVRHKDVKEYVSTFHEIIFN